MTLYKSKTGRLAFYVLSLFVVTGLLVWFFDPFYQYHEPFFGLKAVLNDRDNQMAGTIHNFEYDSLLVGSSVAENFDSEYIDACHDCKTLKVIRASGSTADLLYYVEMAEAEQELDQIIWCLDLFALDASPEVTLFGEDVPRYLHTKTPLDDLPYLYNKEVLLEKIPAMIVCSVKNINVDGDAYNWAKGKVFGSESAMRFYDRPTEIIEPASVSMERYKSNILDNLSALEKQISSHPEIRYRFIFPPYSLLWWDCAWLNGYLEQRFYILESVIPMLLAYENVEVYYYQNDDEIVCNLDYYMDMIHYSPVINQRMLEKMEAGEGRLTLQNAQDEMEKMKHLVQRIIQEDIYRYYSMPE